MLRTTSHEVNFSKYCCYKNKTNFLDEIKKFPKFFMVDRFIFRYFFIINMLDGAL